MYETDGPKRQWDLIQAIKSKLKKMHVFVPFTDEWPIWTGRDVLQPVLRVIGTYEMIYNLPSIR